VPRLGLAGAAWACVAGAAAQVIGSAAALLVGVRRERANLRPPVPQRHRPLRVLHVIGRLNPGGVESWLLNVFRVADPELVRHDLMVHHPEPGAYDADAQALGVTLHVNAEFRNPVRYYRRLKEIVGSPPRYDIIHSHVHHYSAVVLACAVVLGLRTRIAHSHNDTKAVDGEAGIARHAYLRSMKLLLRATASKGFACSEVAAVSLFGQNWHDDSRWRLLYYGIDPSRFTDVRDPLEIRDELGLPRDAQLLIHVGRFDRQKNHAFLTEVFQELARVNCSAYLVLVGTGPLLEETRARVRHLGLEDRVRFCGRRFDIPQLLTASDLFIFPSHHEGLPVACLEAQAAGLALLISDRITPEVIVRRDCVTVLPLGDAAAWARQAATDLLTPRNTPAGIAAFTGSVFDIRRSAASLFEGYREAGSHGPATATDGDARVVNREATA
jgi:glycosyltransferase involved in cell wall biosynthesis